VKTYSIKVSLRGRIVQIVPPLDCRRLLSLKGVMNTAKKFSPEVRERVVRMVFEHKGEHESEWAAMSSIASKIGCTPETLRRWVRQSECDQGVRGGLTRSDRERLKALERENRQLKRANEILRKASAFLPRRNSAADRSDGVVH